MRKQTETQPIKTLEDLLAMRAGIVTLAKQFGYDGDNVRVYHDATYAAEYGDQILHLIVKAEEGGHVPYKISGYLEAMLSDYLDCKVDVKDYQNIPNLYQYDTDQKSVLLTDESALKQLFESSETTFSSIKDEESILLQRSFLKFAKKYLQEKSEMSSPSKAEKRKELPSQNNRAYALIGHSSSGSRHLNNSDEDLSNSPKESDSKKAKFTVNESEGTVSLVIYMQKGNVVKPEKNSNEDIANYLAEKYFEKLKKETEEKPEGDLKF